MRLENCYRIAFRRAGRAVPFLLFLLALSGCLGVPLYYKQPAQSPDAYFVVNLDSIPSGASIYVGSRDGTMGQLLGTTPMQWRIGTSVQRDNNGQVGLAPVLPGTRASFVRAWIAPGAPDAFAIYERDGNSFSGQVIVGFDMVMNIILVKDGAFPTPVQNKVIASFYSDAFGNSPTYPPRNVTLTVPLSLNQQGQQQGQPQQQQQQQQQQVIIINN